MLKIPDLNLTGLSLALVPLVHTLHYTTARTNSINYIKCAHALMRDPLLECG
jgi:hypothetical protein